MDGRTAVVCEIRDTLTQLTRMGAASRHGELEAAALRASHGQILVTAATRDYLGRLHGLDLGGTSILVPHAFARATMAPPSPKLSAADGRLHLAIVGTAVGTPSHSRW